MRQDLLDRHLDNCCSAGGGQVDRRGFLHSVAGGVYGAAVASLLAGEVASSQRLFASESKPTGRARPTHFPPKAKSVIQLFMNGGPSQMDLFDPKPMLDKRHGEKYFDKIASEVEFQAEAGAIMRSPFKFAQHGQSGMWISDAMPYLATQADELCMIRSMYTVNTTHEPAIRKIHTGQMIPGHPVMGSWISYGLGSENANLPAYLVLDDPRGLPVMGVENWQAGFLPPQHQGTRLRSKGVPVVNLMPAYDEPEAVSQTEQQLIAALGQMHRDARPHQAELDARIASYEMAARMQVEATDALDLSQESADTLALYGIGEPTTDSYGRRCLMARRLVERGVRFVQLFIQRQIWDNHTQIATTLRNASEKTDKPTAGLLQDLRQRGLMDDTLVLWCGEFGRLPIAQLRGTTDDQDSGRDHNKNAFTVLMAGAGVKRGLTYGATDELGFAAVENRVSVCDWHATILQLMGVDVQKLTYDVHGLKERLTGVFEYKVVQDILA
jgi:hypothetical protein